MLQRIINLSRVSSIHSRMEQEVYAHLRKKGLIEESERKAKRPQASLTTFDPQTHVVTGVASSTLWKVVFCLLFLMSCLSLKCGA